MEAVEKKTCPECKGSGEVEAGNRMGCNVVYSECCGGDCGSRLVTCSECGGSGEVDLDYEIQKERDYNFFFLGDDDYDDI